MVILNAARLRSIVPGVSLVQSRAEKGWAGSEEKIVKIAVAMMHLLHHVLRMEEGACSGEKKPSTYSMYSSKSDNLGCDEVGETPW
jgi:hypothetical protein